MARRAQPYAYDEILPIKVTIDEDILAFGAAGPEHSLSSDIEPALMGSDPLAWSIRSAFAFAHRGPLRVVRCLYPGHAGPDVV